jgi:hypothetical protein
VLNPIKVFNGSFGGETMWENPNYVTPNAVVLNINLNCLKANTLFLVSPNVELTYRIEVSSEN